jgi:hypothetical protein
VVIRSIRAFRCTLSSKSALGLMVNYGTLARYNLAKEPCCTMRYLGLSRCHASPVFLKHDQTLGARRSRLDEITELFREAKIFTTRKSAWTSTLALYIHVYTIHAQLLLIRKVDHFTLLCPICSAGKQGSSGVSYIQHHYRMERGLDVLSLHIGGCIGTASSTRRPST